MNNNPKQLAALCIVTVFAIFLIFVIGAQNREKSDLIRSAGAYTPIYQFTEQSTGLTKLIQHQQLLSKNPLDAALAHKTARLSLQQYSTNGNSRFLGTAKSALAPWWTDPEPPLDIWLTRARITQTKHDFKAAAKDLSLLNRKHRGKVGALLLESDTWRRAGLIVPAKTACISVAFTGRPDLTRFCTVEILLSQGDFSQAGKLMQNTMKSTLNLPAPQQTWARSIYADTLLANGQLDAAAEIWASVIQTGTAMLTHRLAYADVLITQSRWQQVYDLLIKDIDNTAALLRLTVAARQIDESEYPKLRDRLASRLKTAATTKQANLYLRERALFSLWIEQDSSQALDYALRNWGYQKGWEDSELVLHIAKINGNKAAIRQIEQWRAQSSSVGKG